MEFLLQLFAELLSNNEEVVSTEEREMELLETVEVSENEDFFKIMHFH